MPGCKELATAGRCSGDCGSSMGVGYTKRRTRAAIGQSCCRAGRCTPRGRSLPRTLAAAVWRSNMMQFSCPDDSLLWRQSQP